MKFQIKIKPEILKLIQEKAQGLGLFDSRFSEEEQCGGYFAFKQLCLQKEATPSDKFIKYDGSWDKMYDGLPGIYLLRQIHPALRSSLLRTVSLLRNLIYFKTYE